MVNVGGRSRGCSTCRRRRVKCDENRPICMRCQRCGFECSGVKETAFIEAKVVKSRRSEKWTKVGTNHDAKICDSRLPKTAVSPAVALKWVDIHIYICYAKKYLLRGGPVDLALQDLYLSDLIAAETSKDSKQIFHRAVLSFAIIFFGNEHKQPSITKRGYSIYGVALKQLNKALTHPSCCVRDDIILSVVAFALLECFVPTGPKYYLKHMFGLERLLELRRPTANCSPESVGLYKGVRRMLLFASLSTGKPSILSRPEWKNVFSTACSSEEIEEQHLFNILADCTVLIAERDEALAIRRPDLSKAARQLDQVKQKALALLRDLCAWRRQWDNHCQNAHFKTPAATLVRFPLDMDYWMHRPQPFTTVFEFANDSAATMLIFYHTASIYVLKVLSSLALEIPSIYSDQNYPTNQVQGTEDCLWRDTKDSYLAAERSAALEICRCLQYHLLRKSRLDSGTLTIGHLAITTAWTTLRGSESAEGRWMAELVNSRSGEVMAKGLWAN